jgi:hypothetical protein
MNPTSPATEDALIILTIPRVGRGHNPSSSDPTNRYLDLLVKNLIQLSDMIEAVKYSFQQRGNDFNDWLSIERIEVAGMNDDAGLQALEDSYKALLKGEYENLGGQITDMMEKLDTLGGLIEDVVAKTDQDEG